MTAALTVSVVVPTHNRCHVLKQTLPALLDQDFPQDAYEVVVVVDGSTDETLSYLRGLQAPNLRVEVQANAGPAVARNRGIELSNGKIILMLDDDLICERDLVRVHAGRHALSADAQIMVLGPISMASPAPGNEAAIRTGNWLTACYTD